MTGRVLPVAGAPALAAAFGIPLAGVAAREPPAGGAPQRTPWGDPDIRGIVSTDDELGVPFERPQELGEPVRRSSIVADPTNGQIPNARDAARARSRDAVNVRTSGRVPYDGPGALDHYDDGMLDILGAARAEETAGAGIPAEYPAWR
jgi:hypothetical protein